MVMARSWYFNEAIAAVEMDAAAAPAFRLALFSTSSTLWAQWTRD